MVRVGSTITLRLSVTVSIFLSLCIPRVKLSFLTLARPASLPQHAHPNPPAAPSPLSAPPPLEKTSLLKPALTDTSSPSLEGA